MGLAEWSVVEKGQGYIHRIGIVHVNKMGSNRYYSILEYILCMHKQNFILFWQVPGHGLVSGIPLYVLKFTKVKYHLPKFSKVKYHSLKFSKV